MFCQRDDNGTIKKARISLEVRAFFHIAILKRTSENPSGKYFNSDQGAIERRKHERILIRDCFRVRLQRRAGLKD